MQANRFTKGNFSDRFLILIEASGKSQRELAAMLSVSEASLVQWKRGRVPGSEELYQISRLFGVSMEWLLTGSDTAADGGNLWKNKAQAAEKLLGEIRSALETLVKKI